MSRNAHPRKETTYYSDEDQNDDLYTSNSNEEEDIQAELAPKPQRQRKPAKPTQSRQRSKRQQHKTRDLFSEADDIDPEPNAVQPYERTKSQQLESSPTQAHGRIQKREAAEEEQIQPKEKDEDTGLKLRLDLNLDIEVELKARIHGDLTLALLS